MSGQRHPDAEALARYKAGQVVGFRARRLAAHVTNCARCASVSDQLTEVSTVLASVTAPMPDAVERQIMSALTAEAAARQPAAPATVSPGGAHGSRAKRRRERRLTRERGPARRHEWRIRPVAVFASAGACLLLAGFGYLLTQTGASSSSSAASSAAIPAAGSVPSPEAAAPGHEPALLPMEGVSGASFLVVSSGTHYRQATLAAQVRVQLAQNATPASSASQPATAQAEASASSGGRPPSRSLTECVLHLTRNVAPSLVDRATYEDKPAYVIAVPDRAWVVGLGCTASDPELVTSVALH